MPTVESGDAQIHVEVRGSGDTVLLIQGVGVPSCGWGPQGKALEAAGYRVIAFDNRGIGKSTITSRLLTIEDMAEDARRVLDANGIDRAHVVGHSMGGIIAQALALDAPERIASLSLLCTFLRGKDAAKVTPWKVWIGLRCHVGTRRMRRRAFLEMVSTRAHLAAVDTEAMAEELKVIFGRDLADQPSVVMRQVKALRKHDCSGRLGELKHIPTWVLSGAEDRMASAAGGRALAEAIGGRYEVWSNAAHGLTVHQADRVNEGLLRHIATASESPTTAHMPSE